MYTLNCKRYRVQHSEIDTWVTSPWWAYPWPWLVLFSIVSVVRWPSWTALTNGWHYHGPPAHDTALTDPASQTEALIGTDRLPDHCIYRSFSLRILFLSVPACICDRLIASSLAVYQICSGVTLRYIASAPADRLVSVTCREFERKRGCDGKTEDNRRIQEKKRKIIGNLY